MNSEPLRLGSRRSPMAIAQSGDVARLVTERTGRRVEDPVRGGNATQAIGQVPAGRTDRHHLQVLAEGVLDLAVARDDLALDRLAVEQRLVRQGVHAAHEGGEVALDDEVGAVIHELLDRAWDARHHARADGIGDALARDVRVLL